MDYFNNSLPLEIQLDIFSRVPVEFVRDCKSVCKTWNNLIHHPSFSTMHLHRINNDDSGKLGFLASTQEFKYFEYDQNHESTTPVERIRRVNLKTPFNLRTSIVGSCNGLICLGGRLYVCICNPITREHITLPRIQFFDTHRCFRWTSGFGYVSSTNEYKVVGISVHYSRITDVHIYTLGSGNGWRNLGKFIIDFGLEYSEQCVFANGALYWIGSKKLGMVINFDLAQEIFCEHLPAPVLPPNNNWSLNRIGVLDGFLYFAAQIGTEGEDDICFDIWLLEKKNDTKEREEHQSFGWTKKFRLKNSKLVAVMKSGGILTHTGGYLNMYDPKASTSKRVVDFKERIRKIYPHKNTLVSLKELGEGTEIMESIEIEKTETCDSPLLQPEEVEALDTLVSLKELIMGKNIRR